MTDIDAILIRIKSWAGRRGRKSMLARETGLSNAALNDLGSLDWNPTADTIRKLDAAVTKLSAVQPTHPQQQD